MTRSAVRTISSTHPVEDDPEVSIDSRSAVLEIMLETNPFTGTRYFERLTESIARYFAADAVYLCELGLELESSRLLAAHESEVVARPDNLFMRGGICELILDRGTVVQARSGVPSGSPKVLRSSSFIGTTVRARSGDPLGVLFILHQAPLPQSTTAAAVLEQLAIRAAAEIERTQQDAALRRNESRMRLLTDHSTDALFLLLPGPEPRMQYVSPAAEAVLGLPPEAFYANPRAVLDLVDPQDRPRLEDAFASGSEEPVTVRIRREGDGPRRIEYRDYPIVVNGKLVAIGAMMRDVTRQVEIREGLDASEHLWRSLLESIPDTLVLVRHDGEVTYYKPGEVRLALAGTNQAVGHNVKSLVPPSAAGVLERALRVGSRSRRAQRLQLEAPPLTPVDVSCLPIGHDQLLLVLRELNPGTRVESGDSHRAHQGDEAEADMRYRRSNAYNLTERELAVLDLIVGGMADKQIAEALRISIFTVNKHVGNILSKMNAASRTEAGVRAIKESLLESLLPGKEPTSV